MVQTVVIHGTNSGNSWYKQWKYRNSNTNNKKYLISSTSLFGILRHLSTESFLLDLLQPPSLQDLVDSPLGSHVSASVFWREWKIVCIDSSFFCPLNLFPHNWAPVSEWPPVLGLPLFFLLLHFVLLDGVTLAAGAWLILRELLDLKMESKFPGLLHSGK